jgi:hypothetical protein
MVFSCEFFCRWVSDQWGWGRRSHLWVSGVLHRGATGLVPVVWVLRQGRDADGIGIGFFSLDVTEGQDLVLYWAIRWSLVWIDEFVSHCLRVYKGPNDPTVTWLGYGKTVTSDHRGWLNHGMIVWFNSCLLMLIDLALYRWHNQLTINGKNS